MSSHSLKSLHILFGKELAKRSGVSNFEESFENIRIVGIKELFAGLLDCFFVLYKIGFGFGDMVMLQSGAVNSSYYILKRKRCYSLGLGTRSDTNDVGNAVFEKMFKELVKRVVRVAPNRRSETGT